MFLIPDIFLFYKCNLIRIRNVRERTIKTKGKFKKRESLMSILSLIFDSDQCGNFDAALYGDMCNFSENIYSNSFLLTPHSPCEI